MPLPLSRPVVLRHCPSEYNMKLLLSVALLGALMLPASAMDDMDDMMGGMGEEEVYKVSHYTEKVGEEEEAVEEDMSH